MTIKVSKEMRKRIDAMKNKKELVTDQSYKDINNSGFIYESPDGGRTIYRQRPRVDFSSAEYCDVSGVKIDRPQQLEFDFNDERAIHRLAMQDEVKESVLEMEEKISQIVTLLGEVTEGIHKLSDNN